jgi:hypothetical protein
MRLSPGSWRDRPMRERRIDLEVYLMPITISNRWQFDTVTN